MAGDRDRAALGDRLLGEQLCGAALRFDGQLMVFDLGKPDSPCYACLFPEDAQVEEVQCSTMGVFAPLTGVIGAMQAMEAVKLLTGVGGPTGLQIFEAKSTEWRSVRLKKDPACVLCGDAPTQRGLIDYEGFCASPSEWQAEHAAKANLGNILL